MGDIKARYERAGALYSRQCLRPTPHFHLHTALSVRSSIFYRAASPFTPTLPCIQPSPAHPAHSQSFRLHDPRFPAYQTSPFARHALFTFCFCSSCSTRFCSLSRGLEEPHHLSGPFAISCFLIRFPDLPCLATPPACHGPLRPH